MKKRITIILVTMSVATLLVVPLASSATKKTLDAGSTWEVVETTSLKSLTIKDGAVIKAPEGYSITMTVDGVETPIEAGTYKGNIVLTPTEEIVVSGAGGPNRDNPLKFRIGVDIEDGKYVQEKSVSAAVVGGEVTDSYVKDVRITSVGDHFNGIRVIGDSEYSINNAKINFKGNGGNDFAGHGAGIMASGNANVTLDNSEIITDGVIRTTVYVGGHSTMHVNNSYMSSDSPPLPEVVSGMMEPPWELSLDGTCRATMVCEYGTAIYTNSHIKAQRWGALSTDGCRDVKLYAFNCIIETIDSGYGTYSEGNCAVAFSGCTLNVADYAMIMQGGDGVFTDGTVVNSKRNGVMVHSGRGRGTEILTIDRGSVFNTEEAVMLIKTSGPDIIVDNAKLNSKNGIILQSMLSDDPHSGTVEADLHVTFSNMSMDGDIVNSNTTKGNLKATFKNVTIKGAITTAIAEGVGVIDKEHRENIGRMINRYCDPSDKYGVIVLFDKDSQWIIDKTSYLTSLTIGDGAAITAPQGYSVTMTVDGIGKEIKAGTYKGKIVFTVTKS